MSVCRACAEMTSGDCGMHGPRFIPTTLGGVMGSWATTDEVARLKARVAALTAERDAARDAMTHADMLWQGKLDGQIRRVAALTAALEAAALAIERLMPPSCAPDDDADGWAALVTLGQVRAALDAARGA